MTKELETSSIDKLINKAKSIGHDEVPQNTDELTEKMLTLFERTGKIFSAKEMFSILQEKSTKWYSDKMWQLAKKGVLVKLETRGYYQFVEKVESAE